ncbi:hypothetical protein BKA82DRAFT_326824 [Pisolithus tinctorius]|uniref:G domain-containing protein n=1 Tax=Pisolithus tinctorius Marx 270 TaxID=870435 RepID=A0A0C3PKN3_PISTI|nr:hypothetical protein BKA82DRAFT_326824 [Pisolithus tinctorius]KIO08804.1 hypothetical protein M404DRAFT_326824 [Pisolithus tinctorius Marx 270]
MGPTGSGKSSFIDKATGCTGAGVGHDLTSCTSEIKVTRCVVEQSNVVLVDTPGFDGTMKSNLKVLDMISDWLNKEYQTGATLSALLYFHRISDNRMAGLPLGTLRVFRKLYGENSMQDVTLVTTMWDEVEDDVGQQRLAELKESYWKMMISQGAMSFEHMNTQASAMQLLVSIVHRKRVQEGVLLQQEILDLKLELREIATGLALCSHLEDLARRRMEALRRIEVARKGADEKTFLDLCKEYAQVQSQLNAALVEARALRMPPRNPLSKGIRIVWRSDDWG